MKQYENVMYMDIISREYVPEFDNNIYIEVTYLLQLYASGCYTLYSKWYECPP